MLKTLNKKGCTVPLIKGTTENCKNNSHKNPTQFSLASKTTRAKVYSNGDYLCQHLEAHKHTPLLPTSLPLIHFTADNPYCGQFPVNKTPSCFQVVVSASLQ